MGKWVLEVTGSKLFGDDFKLEVDDYTVIAGFNSTGKSIIARTIYALASRDVNELDRLWRKDNASVCLRTPRGNLCYAGGEIRGDLGSDIVAYMAPDYRIVLRQSLVLEKSISESIEGIEQDVGTLCNMIDSLSVYIPEEESNRMQELKELCKDLQQHIKNHGNVLRGFMHPLLAEALIYKARANPWLLKKLLDAQEESIERAVDALNELLGDIDEKISAEDLIPLSVDVTISDTGHVGKPALSIDLGSLALLVQDNRLTATVPPDVVSSSVASYLLLGILPYVFAQRENTIVAVIEEPEEAFSPPQQFLFAYILGRYIRLLQGNGKEVKVVLTTHSPYIVSGASRFDATIYYARFSRKKRAFYYEQRPYAAFALAEALALSQRPSEEEEL